ncbi:hypothetical protein T260_00030 [Geobacillus thermopakistaniensis]|uniref:Uncharacterized protein n=1 Tax=Geobacillus thermopakistaniensis (strain MAS1) TaxID=1408282 RepID=A0A7U9P824_GEOTM|nr:hypothetical protein T260_00030 [Geobacillus sp. MAS1]
MEKYVFKKHFNNNFVDVGGFPVTYGVSSNGENIFIRI